MSKPDSITDQIKISSPCNVDWNSMVGNDRIRVCEHCQLSVHNLSTMSFAQIEDLVVQSNGHLCVRYFHMPDGSPMVARRPSVLLQLGRKSSRIAAGALTVAMAMSGATAAYAQGGTRAKPAQVEDKGKDQRTGATNYASIKGFALDANGAAIGNTTVTITSATGKKETVISGELGDFHFQLLDTGTFTLEIKSIGFMDFRIKDIKLAPGEDKTIKAVLQVGSELIGIVAYGEALEVERVIVKSISRPQETGVTPLMVAVKESNEESITQLLRSGSDVNASTSYGTTARMSISPLTTSYSVTVLLLAGADLHLTDIYDRTALVIAAETGSSNVLQKLIDAGSNINYPDRDGNTPLIHAVLSKRSDNVQVLISAKPDFKLRNNKGLTALQYALKQNSPEIVRVLKSAGAVE